MSLEEPRLSTFRLLHWRPSVTIGEGKGATPSKSYSKLQVHMQVSLNDESIIFENIR